MEQQCLPHGLVCLLLPAGSLHSYLNRLPEQPAPSASWQWHLSVQVSQPGISEIQRDLTLDVMHYVTRKVLARCQSLREEHPNMPVVTYKMIWDRIG